MPGKYFYFSEFGKERVFGHPKNPCSVFVVLLPAISSALVALVLDRMLCFQMAWLESSARMVPSFLVPA